MRLGGEVLAILLDFLRCACMYLAIFLSHLIFFHDNSEDIFLYIILVKIDDNKDTTR